METFDLTSPLFCSCGDGASPCLCGLVRHISQCSSGDIGSKVYPGALILLGEIENAAGAAESATIEPTPLHRTVLRRCLRERRGIVLELGAGVCGIPGIAAIALQCQHTLLTDLPSMADLLLSNVTAAELASRATADSLVDTAAPVTDSQRFSVMPLAWGSRDDVVALRSHLASLRRDSLDVPDIILGADVVYHEHLIEPLLQTLVMLTDGTDSPPAIVLSYVQRFKRAKDFFKRARKLFNVSCCPVADVVDYDVLTWQLPALQRQQGDTGPTVYSSRSVCFATYDALWQHRDAAAAAAAVSVETAPAGAAAHGVDSDTDDEYSEGGALTADRVFASLAPDATLQQRRAEPCKAYMYTLQRRV